MHNNQKTKSVEQSSKSNDLSDFDLAYEFAKQMKLGFKDFVRAIVVFGSLSKEKNVHKKTSDIDLLIIIDDVKIELSPEIVESYRILTEKIIANVSTRLHVTSLKYSTFWEYIRVGDPIGINMLREGIPLIDSANFFNTMQILLKTGSIKPSSESIWTYFARSPSTMQNAKWHVMQGALDLYWAVIDSAHALLMDNNIMPPPPEMVCSVMKKELVSKGIIKEKFAEEVDEFYKLSKYITHRDLKEMSGKDFDSYYKRAYDFIEYVRQLLIKNHDFKSK
jgi:predicted nucleotidyltransferase